jgi:carbon-monoxide dehydrogenase medium subunit
MLALRLAAPAHLVDLGRIAELRTFDVDGGMRIGAAITQRHVERAASLPTVNPLLAEALPLIAHPPIRNRGTVCGSIAHADPAAELPTVMVALDGTMSLRGPSGRRAVAARDFFVSYLDTVRADDEILEHVDIPAWPRGAGWSFQELSRRSGDFAIAGVAVVLTMADDLVADARVACCGVAATPVRLDDVEAALVGRTIDAATVDDAAALAHAAVDPPSDVHAPGSYRRHLVGVLVRRAVTTAAERAGVAA